MTTTPRTSLIDTLQKILALTTSPVEGEATAAAAMLAKLLTKHNLSMADLEQRGADSPSIEEKGHDLGKAAFVWKLDLADAIADHYYCFSIVDRRSKSVRFLGRPDNVEALQMLYSWLIDQIKRIATDERRKHIAETGAHIDPLRWQVNFGIGVVHRLAQRLEEQAAHLASDNATTALVIHHKSEISDYMEEKYGRRVDGQKTKYQREADARWDGMREQWAAKEAQKVADRAEMDDEAYYDKYPEEHPDVKAAREKRAEREDKAWRKREERNARRRTGRQYRYMSDAEWEKQEQAGNARSAGVAAGDRVNLQPFISGGGVSADSKRIEEV